MIFNRLCELDTLCTNRETNIASIVKETASDQVKRLNLNGGERRKDAIDHCIYVHNLTQLSK